MSLETRASLYNLSTNPAPLLKPDLPIVPDPPNNLEPPTKPDPSTNPASLPKSDPPNNTDPISAARVEALLRRRNGDVYAATISYQREVEGRKITVDRHLNQLFPFLDVEKQKPQETIHRLAEDHVAENLTQGKFNAFRNTHQI